MKKMITAILALALMASLAACGTKAPAETTVPTTEAVVETTEAMDATESLEETEALEQTETEKLIDAIYANHAPIDLPLMSMVLDLTDLEFLTANTGLASADNVSEVVINESMIGAQPYSMVVAQVAEGADAAAVAQEMFDNINQRKWICVEADTKTVGYAGDVVMLFMVNSDFADTASTETMMNAFRAAVGVEVTEIG